MGVSLINYDLLKYLKHYLWVFNLKKVPTLKIIYNKAKEVSQEDVVLCERLIAAYRKATAERSTPENNTSLIWSEGLKRYSGKLMTVVERGNAHELALLLSRMFREDFVYGLASGSLVEHSKSRIGSKIWSLKYQDNVVSLAEYLGLVRAESTQQGLRAYGLKDGITAVVSQIEACLGISIGFPDIGSPYGVKANSSLITMEHPEHLYVALRISQAARDHLNVTAGNELNLLEIGAGFGGLAYWLLKLKDLKIRTYTIIDLPLINVLQGYFLSQAFTVRQVKLYGEIDQSSACISILPNVAFEPAIKQDIDVLVNENSMPEMSEEIVSAYISFAKKRLRGIFFSYNHEAYSIVHGKPQVWVPEVVAQVGGFKRLGRNASWVRSGYVEEIYLNLKDKENKK